MISCLFRQLCHALVYCVACSMVALGAEPEIFPQGPDLDETHDGVNQIIALEEAAETHHKRRLVLKQLRAPVAEKLSIVSGELKSLEEKIAQFKNIATGLGQAALQLRTQLLNANRANDFNLIVAITANRNQVSNELELLKAEINELEASRDELLPTWQELSRQVVEYDQELEKIGKELDTIRTQWVEVRQLPKKFARADYEKLKEVTDDWLILDGSWPEARCWAALVAVELGEVDAAKLHVEEAKKALKEVAPDVVAWPLLEAIKGYLLIVNVKERQKGLTQLKLAHEQANKLVEKRKPQGAWFVYLIIGKAYAKTESKQLEAIGIFKKSAKIGGSSYAIDFALAELFVRGKEKVRDLDEAISLLDKLWLSTGQRSWRIAYLLTIANEKSGKKTEADRFWGQVKTLAPADRLATLAKERTQFK